MSETQIPAGNTRSHVGQNATLVVTFRLALGVPADARGRDSLASI
jgi:hypothetical protein